MSCSHHIVLHHALELACQRLVNRILFQCSKISRHCVLVSVDIVHLWVVLSIVDVSPDTFAVSLVNKVVVIG